MNPWVDAAPDHWRRIRLKNLIQHVQNGTWGQEPDDVQSGTVCIRAADFDRQHNTVNKAKLVRRSLTPAEVAKHLLRAGDIVLEKSGGGEQQPVGAAIIFDLDIPAVPTNFAARVRPGRHTEPRFLNYVLRATYNLRINQRSIKQTTGIQNLDADSFFAERWAVPDREEQRAICDFLDRETARIDALIDTKQKLRLLLGERRKETITFGVRGLLEARRAHDARIPWAPTVRAPWPGVMIKHFATLGTGHTPSRSRPELWESADIPWITTGEIKQVRNDRREVIVETRECVSELGIANSAAELHPAETVVLCRTASAGYSAIMGKDMATSQDFVTWTCSEHLQPRYLLMCLRAMRDDLLGRLAYGSTHKTIYWPDIESLKIPLPSIEEQSDVLRQIDKRIVPLDSASQRISQQVEVLREHRQALITAAVTGQMAIPSAA